LLKAVQVFAEATVVFPMIVAATFAKTDQHDGEQSIGPDREENEHP